VFTAELRKLSDQATIWGKSVFPAVGLFAGPYLIWDVKASSSEIGEGLPHVGGHQKYTVHMAAGVRIWKKSDPCVISVLGSWDSARVGSK